MCARSYLPAENVNYLDLLTRGIEKVVVCHWNSCTKPPTKQLAKLVTTMKSFSLVLSAALASSVIVSAQNCTVCGTTNNSFTKPNAAYDGVTCAELQSSIGNITNATECAAQFQIPKWEWLDVPSWCGCEGVVAPETCKICEDDEVFGFPDAIVPWDDEALEYTCAQAVALARHVPDSNTCSAVVATTAAKETCCRPKGALCSVCPIPNAPFQNTAQYQGFTCGMLETDIESLTTDQCSEYFEDSTVSWLNWDSFCGCDGSAAPARCSLCGEGMMVVNPDANAPWEDEVDTFTCAQADELASHVVDNTVCADEVQTAAVIDACCGPAPDENTSGAFDTITVSVVVASMIGFVFVL